MIIEPTPSLEEFSKSNVNEDENIYKKANRRYSAGKSYFTVFRVGDKFKHNPYETNLNIQNLRRFQFHSNREGNTPNADPNKKHLNQVLIGSENVTEDVYAYLEGVKIHKNSVIAREIILSAGNGFWDNLSDYDREKWINANYKFLKDNFGDNCVYAVLHMDETTPHIHALIVPVFFNKKNIPVLNNSFYFGSKEKLSNWQDIYTEAMTREFGNYFKRGIKGSKAKHIDLKTFYALINEDLNTYDSKVILANAKENYLNKKKVEALQETLQQTLEEKKEISRIIEDIIKKNKELKEENKIYEYTIKTLTEKYDIPQNQVYKIIANRDKYKDLSKNKERER